jgi:hypothetical protein
MKIPLPNVHVWTIVLAAIFLLTAGAHLLVLGANDRLGETDTFNYGWPLVWIERDANLQWDENPRFTWFAVNDRRVVEFSLASFVIDFTVLTTLVWFATYGVESLFRRYPDLGRLSITSILAATGFAATISMLELNEAANLLAPSVWPDVIYDLFQPWVMYRIWFLLRMLLIGVAWFGGTGLVMTFVNRRFFHSIT